MRVIRGETVRMWFYISVQCDRNLTLIASTHNSLMLKFLTKTVVVHDSVTFVASVSCCIEILQSYRVHESALLYVFSVR
jgi:hypothetical protein